MPRKIIMNDAPDLAGGVLVVNKPAVANGQATDVAPDSTTPVAAAADLSTTSTNERQSPDAAGAPDHDPMPDAFIGHRPLIRATLPKTENDVPPPRAIPEFTMHQRPASRGGFGGGRSFRPHGFGGHGSSNGGAPQRDGNGPDGNRTPGSGGPGGPGGPGGKSRHRRRHRRPR